MTTAKFLAITPLVPAGSDLAAAIAFYSQHMGFEVTWQSESMAGVRRGSVEMNLVLNSNQAWASNASFSISVDDLDSLYEEYLDIPANIGPLELKSWGRREFHMIIPSGVCLQFFQS